MLGYPRPAPAVRWYNWWSNVALRTYEQNDDDAVLEAEDEAIRAMERGPVADPADLSALMEALRGSEGQDLAEPDSRDGRGVA